jgi:hypothetical protein
MIVAEVLFFILAMGIAIGIFVFFWPSIKHVLYGAEKFVERQATTDLDEEYRKCHSQEGEDTDELPKK